MVDYGLLYWKYFNTSNTAKKMTATTQTKKNAANAVEAPWFIISMLKTVCNAMARISPSAAAVMRPGGRYLAENASAKPIAAEAITWSNVEPRNRTSPVNKPETKFPSESGAMRKSIFSAQANPRATVIM